MLFDSTLFFSDACLTIIKLRVKYGVYTAYDTRISISVKLVSDTDK